MENFKYELKAMKVIKIAARKSNKIPHLIGDKELTAVANYIKNNATINVKKVEELTNQ